MRRRLRRRYGRASQPPTRKYLVYRHGEFFRSVQLHAPGASKSAREDAAKSALTREYGGGLDVEEVG